MSALGLKNPWC